MLEHAEPLSKSYVNTRIGIWGIVQLEIIAVIIFESERGHFGGYSFVIFLFTITFHHTMCQGNFF